MKKNLYSNRRAGTVVVVVAFVLLQSCCFLFNPTVGKQKKCNCRDDAPAYAGSNQPETKPPSSAITSGDVPPASFAIIDQDALTLVDAVTEPATAPLTGNAEAGSENTEAIDPHQAKPVNYLLDQLVLPGQQKRMRQSEKKLPLGIRGINTSLIAAPNLSFKSSKEDYGGTNHKHKPGVGFQFGIGTTYMFSEKFAVSTSLLFKQNNASEVLSYNVPGEPGGGGDQEFTTKYSYSYLSAPILAEFKLSDQLTASAGPELNYLLGASAKAESTYGDGKSSLTESSVKLGVGMQLGLRYELPNSPVAIQLLYDHRLSRLNEKNESDYYPGGGNSETPAWNMKSIQLGIICSLCELMKK